MCLHRKYSVDSIATCEPGINCRHVTYFLQSGLGPTLVQQADRYRLESTTAAPHLEPVTNGS